MKKKIFYLFLIACLAFPVYAKEARLMRQPTISSNSVAFVYANDVWVVSRDGGNARRLTTHKGSESYPVICT